MIKLKKYEEAATIIEEAKTQLQKVVMTHPQHSQSHYSLGELLAKEGGKAEPILVYQMAIISNRNSPVLNKSYTGMEDVMQNNFEVTNEQELNKFFKTLNNMIESKVAMKRGYKTDLGLPYFIDKQTNLLFKQFSYKEGSDDFTMNYYGKFINEVKKRNLEKGYILYILSVINNPIVTKAISKNQKVYDAFSDFVYDYWFEYQQGKKFEIDGKIDDRDYYYNKSGFFFGVGKENSKEKKIGDWVYYHSNGKVKAKTSYDDDGMLMGECFWYDEDGFLKESGNFDHGDISGVSYYTRKNSGTPRYTGHFKDGKLDGELVLYDRNGILSEKKNFLKGELNGVYQEYYDFGMLSSEGNFKDGELTGWLVNYHSSGDTLNAYLFEKGKKEGAFKEFHQNGKVAVIGQYSNNEKSGEWVEYYNDGTYLKMEDFSDDTSFVSQYKKGKLHGEYHDYIENAKILWTHLYKNDKLKKYYNYYVNGNLLNKGKLYYVINDRFGYKYIEAKRKGKYFHGKHLTYFKNGNIKYKKNYYKGDLNGWYTKYYAWGEKELDMYYKYGKAHGKFVSYYDNGETYAEGYYSNDDKVGEWKYYHPNGELEKTQYYVDGKQVGYITYYSLDGKVKNKYFYKDGDVLYQSTIHDTTGACIESIFTPQGNGAYNFKDANGFLYLKSNLENGLHTGDKTFYYPNGQISEKGKVIHGTDHGEFVAYFAGGTLKEKGLYVYGLKHGEWNTYYNNGALYQKAVYDNGNFLDSLVRFYPNGNRRSCYYYDANFNLIQENYYHPNGVLNCEIFKQQGFIVGTYSNFDAFGELCLEREYNGGMCTTYTYMKEGKKVSPIQHNGTGEIKSFYNNGQVGIDATEKNGLYEGAYVRYHSNGELWSKSTMLHDEDNGIEEEYYENGQLYTRKSYHMGRLNGLYKEFTADGKLFKKINYVEGTRHGWSHYYDKNGKVKYSIYFRDGRWKGIGCEVS